MASVHVNVTDFTKLPGEHKQHSWYFPELTILGKKKSYWQIVVSAEIGGKQVDCLPYLTNEPTVATARIDVLSRIQRNSGGSTVRDAVPTYIVAGKNIGKKSETNAVCQAMRTAYGQYLKKTKSTTGFIPPMLAQIYKDQKGGVTFPVHIQPKYNGLRCVASIVDGEVVLQSRTGGIYPGLDYLKSEIKSLNLGNIRLDGELYTHGMSLQDISGIARGDKGDDVVTNDLKLNYVVYDITVMNNLNVIYTTRKELLDDIFNSVSTAVGAQLTKVIRAPTTIVNNETELQQEYNKYIADSYEGAMVRINASYEPGYNGYHSKYLLKIKPCLDSEYPLTGWEMAKNGKAKGALMVICSVNNTEFTVTPAMELPARIALAKLMKEVEPNSKSHFENHYKNRQLTVYYDELSDGGVPLRARTKLEFRD